MASVRTPRAASSVHVIQGTSQVQTGPSVLVRCHLTPLSSFCSSAYFTSFHPSVHIGCPLLAEALTFF